VGYLLLLLRSRGEWRLHNCLHEISGVKTSRSELRSVSDANQWSHKPVSRCYLLSVNRPPKLSSDMTVFSKYILPGVFLCSWPVWFFGALSHGDLWIPTILWAAVCIWLVVWSRPMKFVALDGDSFCISNYFSTCAVPISRLCRIEQDRNNRTPTITLYFEPPTPFGKRVRIVPPIDFRRAAFDEVSSFLQSVLNAKR
jgi:hypothetical protein